MADQETWRYQGRQEHGRFGSGTAPRSDPGAGSAETPHTETPPPPYVASDLSQFLGHGQVGNGECVARVKRATGAPATSSWHAGELAETHPVPPNTAAAFFGADGRYGNNTDGTSHALIITEWTPRGFWALEQYNIRDPGGNIIQRVAPATRFYEFGRSNGPAIFNGSNYRVIR